jgi:hypothetical protein
VPLSNATIRPEPAPCKVIPLPEIVTPEVQEQVPAGMITVSPCEAELMAACTSLLLQVAAEPVLACTAVPERALNIAVNKTHFSILDDLVIGTFLNKIIAK